MANPVDRLEYNDDTARTLVYRVPAQGSLRLASNARLTVSDFQRAVFFRGGQVEDQFGPGVYVLNHQSLPKLSRDSDGENLPAASIYFLGMQVFLHQKWGTKHPIVLQDDQFGAVRLRSFGSYAFDITDPGCFLADFVESKSAFTTDKITTFLQERIVSTLGDKLQSLSIKLINLPRLFDEVAQAVQQELVTKFSALGLNLIDFFINSISVPREVQEAIDREHGEMAFDNLRAFTLAQAATQRSLRNESSAKPDKVRQLVRSVIDSAKWNCTEVEAGIWRVAVPIGSMRKQTVLIDFTARDAEGHDVISFTSICGPASPEKAMALLRHNVQMVHGAFAVQASHSGEMLVVQGNQLADTADELEVTRILTAVAWQADQAEERLWGSDQY